MAIQHPVGPRNKNLIRERGAIRCCMVSVGGYKNPKLVENAHKAAAFVRYRKLARYEAREGEFGVIEGRCAIADTNKYCDMYDTKLEVRVIMVHIRL